MKNQKTMKSNPIRRGLPVLALAMLALSPAANAATLVGITFGPQGGADNGTDYGVLGTTSAGTLDTTTVNGLQSVATASTAIPANDNAGATTVGSTVYSFSISSLTVDGDAGHTLTFDMSLSAGSTEPKPYITVNGGPNRGWVGLSQNTTRFEENETLTFVVSNVLLDGGAGATFTGFTGFVTDVSQNVTQGASASDTYLLQGGGSGAGGSRLRTIDFGFSTEVIP
ncbi:MAG: hypothetical protein ACI8XO_001736, partial [Verrucomicrobiales bacterium]